MTWKNNPPTKDDIKKSPEYYFVRGGGFNYDIAVQVNLGVNSHVVDGKREFFSDVNFRFLADGAPSAIWSNDLKHFGHLQGVKWYGPVKRPE
jgi:hypothetical protein